MIMQNNRVDKTIKKVLTKLVEHEMYGWPPECATFYYQPSRPQNTHILEKHEPEKIKSFFFVVGRKK